MKLLYMLAASLLAIALAPADASAQNQSGRYTPPPPVQLSPDLASPWILQLSRKPARHGGYAVEVAPPVRVIRQRRHYGSGASSHSLANPVRHHRGVLRGTTPLAADPVRRNNPRHAVVAPTPASLPAPSPRQAFDPRYEMQVVPYEGVHAPGTIIIDTSDRFLYLIEEDGMARRYGVGVGREGFGWKGSEKISRKAEWPDWRPPAAMIEREKKKGRFLPTHMPGGPENPLGARALYLGSTLYRIHGTNQPWTIGRAVSSGCIRMRNQDVIDLYERVRVGARVIVS